MNNTFFVKVCTFKTFYPAVLFPNDKHNFVESRNWICQISQHLAASTVSGGSASPHLLPPCIGIGQSWGCSEIYRNWPERFEKTHSILYAVSVDVIYRCRIIFLYFLLGLSLLHHENEIQLVS